MMKMCRAKRLGVSVECIMPCGFPKRGLFDYYGVSDPSEVAETPFTAGPARSIRPIDSHPPFMPDGKEEL